jgi:hypothetical protein
VSSMMPGLASTTPAAPRIALFASLPPEKCGPAPAPASELVGSSTYNTNVKSPERLLSRLLTKLLAIGSLVTLDLVGLQTPGYVSMPVAIEDLSLAGLAAASLTLVPYTLVVESHSDGRCWSIWLIMLDSDAETTSSMITSTVMKPK